MIIGKPAVKVSSTAESKILKNYRGLAPIDILLLAAEMKFSLRWPKPSCPPETRTDRINAGYEKRFLAPGLLRFTLGQGPFKGRR